MRSLIFILLVTSAFLSCKKDNIDMANFWSCHQSLALDSTAVYQKLQGNWKSDRQQCPMSPNQVNKNITVSFIDGGNYILKEGSSITGQGSWSIKKYGNSGWQLNMTPIQSYFYGEILFCENEVMFTNSPVDGCDNVFTRQ